MSKRGGVAIKGNGYILWIHKQTPPRIPGGLTDYKFYCFDGKPKFLYVSKGLENHATAQISFLTMDWEFAPYQRADYAPFSVLPKKPSRFDEMIPLCGELSKDRKFLRVDLYEIQNHIYFSEMTFYPTSGYMPFVDKSQDDNMGKLLNL